MVSVLYHLIGENDGCMGSWVRIVEIISERLLNYKDRLNQSIRARARVNQSIRVRVRVNQSITIKIGGIVLDTPPPLDCMSASCH